MSPCCYLTTSENWIFRSGNSTLKISNDIRMSLDGYSKEAIRDAMQEAIAHADRTSLNDVQKFLELSAETNLMIDGAFEKMYTSRRNMENPDKVTKELSDSLNELAITAGKMQDIVRSYLISNDMVGLKHFSSKYRRFYDINTKMNASNLKDSKSIQDFKRLLDEYVTDALNERESRIRIEDMRDVDNYIEGITRDIEIHESV